MNWIASAAAWLSSTSSEIVSGSVAGPALEHLAGDAILADREVRRRQAGHRLAAAVDDADVDVARAVVAGARRALSVLRLRESGQGQGDCDHQMLHQGEPLVAV